MYRKNANNQAKKTSQELISLFNSYDSYRQQWEDGAIEDYKLYVGHKEALDEDDERSNLHIPRTYQIVDTIRSRIVNAFFKTRPYVDFVPSPSKQSRESLQTSETKADIAAALVDQQLDKNKIVPKFYDYITSLLLFPAGILGVGWRYEEDTITKKVPAPEMVMTKFGPRKTGNYVYQPRQSQEVIWDDNSITNIDFFDFWPDPKATDLEDCRGVFNREEITYQELMNRLEFLEYLNEGIVYPVNYEEILQETNYDNGREKRMSEIGYSTEMGSDYFNSNKEELRKNSKFEILHYWEKDRHAMLLNREKVIYDGPSPYWRHHKLPFIVESYERLPNEFYGKSAVDFIKDLQHEENTIHNQRSDNINMIINKMWKVRKGADIDESELISRPHGVIHVDNPEDVDSFDMRDVAGSSFEQQNIVAQNMENTLGTPPIMRGVSSEGDMTATEAMKQTNNAGMRFDVKIKVFNSMGITRLIELMDLNNQQFIDGDRLVKLGQEKGEEWRTVNPGDLIGEFDYRPAGANIDPAANKQVRREQLSQMMQFLMEAGVPFVNYHELIKEWLESFDIENAQKFIVPKQQWQQQQIMQQQQMNTQNSRDRASQTDQRRAAQAGKGQGINPQQQGPQQERVGGNVR
jgi:hypothetical protein